MARLSINSETIKQWSLEELVAGCVEAGVPGIAPWREPVQEYGVERAAWLIRDAGLTVTSLCRGGFYTAAEPVQRRAALDDNLRAIDEAAALNCPVLVLVSGGLGADDRDLVGARRRVADALAELAPYAGERGVQLAIEPLHPMYCSDRCVVSTLAQALDLAEPFPAEQVGVVVDTYHSWWDPELDVQVRRAGETGRLALFQVADWVTPLPEGVLLGRGQLGDGHVPLREIRELVDSTGHDGPVEVEIFNPALWARNGAEVLTEVIQRYRDHLV
nr:sugar phosphate isomerase/epimerase family protein [Kutzneria buriramensis]